MAPPVTIKKYGNRRLYDTGESRYVTLEELATKIRSGADLRVVDAQTGEDLTQATLTQIVLEAGNAAKFLPVQLLTQMIRLSDDALAEFFSRYVTGALDLYLNAKRGVQTIASYNPLTQLPLAATDALARMWMGSPFAAFQQQQPPPPYGNYPPPPFAAAPPFVAAPPPAAEDQRPLEHAATERAGDAGLSDATGGDRAASAHGAGVGAGAGVGVGERERERERERESEVAAMRRELDELKQAIREGLAAKPARKKRKP